MSKNNKNKPLVKLEQPLQLTSANDIKGFAPALREFITNSKLAITIGTGSEAKEYVLVDGWKFAGMKFGLTCFPDEPELLPSLSPIPLMKREWVASKTPPHKKYPVDTPTGQTIPEVRYKCKATIKRINTGEQISFGYGICSNREDGKNSFDEYAIYSFAQTRAIAKAYRNLLGFMMKAAGYSDTPAEETEVLKKADMGSPDEDIEAIKSQLELLTRVSELDPYYRQLDEGTRKRKDVIEAFSNRKSKIIEANGGQD